MSVVYGDPDTGNDVLKVIGMFLNVIKRKGQLVVEDVQQTLGSLRNVGEYVSELADKVAPVTLARELDVLTNNIGKYLEGPKLQPRNELTLSTRLELEDLVVVVPKKYSKLDDLKYAKKVFTSSVEILKTVVTVTAMIERCSKYTGIFMSEYVQLALGSIMTLGGIVIGWLLKPSEGLNEKMGELNKEFEKISKNMNARLEDLQSSRFSPEFFKEAATALTLMTYMQRTISHPSKESIRNFLRECEKTSPGHLGLKLIHMLSDKSTNPLKMAMNAQNVPKKAVFEKWRETLEAVLAQCLFLEAFYNGMRGGDRNEMEMLNNMITKHKEQTDYLRAQYNSNTAYWAYMQDMIHRVQDNFASSSNEEKAGLLKNTLEEIMTNDAFYILVFDYMSLFGQFLDVYKCYGFSYADEGNVLSSYNRGNCNVVLFRSVGFQRQETYSQQLRTMMITHQPTLVNMPLYCWIFRNNYLYTTTATKDIRAKLGSDCGFVGIVCVAQKPCVKWANCDFEFGPGHFTTEVLEPNNDAYEFSKYLMIAGIC